MAHKSYTYQECLIAFNFVGAVLILLKLNSNYTSAPKSVHLNRLVKKTLHLIFFLLSHVVLETYIV